MLRWVCFLLLFSLSSCLKPRGSIPEADVERPSSDGQIQTSPELDKPDSKMFEREFLELKLLPLAIRGLKLEQWLQDSEQAALARSEIEERAEQLGGQNYALGRPETITWSKPFIEKWLLQIEPFCKHPSISGKFLGEAATSKLFVSAYGREPTAEEVADFQDLDADPSLSELEKFTVKCMALLGSLEFVSQ
jgi:hypothetical protein